MGQSTKLLLDTDVIIEYLRNRDPAVAFIESLEGILLVSVMTLAELFTGVKDAIEEAAIDDFLTPFEIISVGPAIAKQAGRYRQQYKQSHGMGMVDAILAATAESEGAILVSFNQRHYPMLPNLIVPYKR